VTRAIPCCLILTLLAGGCPLQDPADSIVSGLTAKITLSATSGEPPLTVTASGVESSSPGTTIESFSWNFADLAQYEGQLVQHTFTDPGRYAVTLTVVNSNRQQAVDRVYVRIRGGAVTAVITASQVSGPAPLSVQFDGRDSTAVDDTILDYYWDFGDGEQSRSSNPAHAYQNAGTYTVTLRAISAGGVEGSTSAIITVTSDAAEGNSLRFDGAQFARLPVTTAAPLSAFTFETWCNPDQIGGTIVNLGTPNFSLAISPEDSSVSVTGGAEPDSGSATILAEQWHRIAVRYADGSGADIFLDGTLVASLELDGEFDVSQLSLGAGFHGSLAGVSFWSIARTDAELSTGTTADLTGMEDGLLGDWPLDDGSGQTVSNNKTLATDGVLGAGESEEASDPTWSADGP